MLINNIIRIFKSYKLHLFVIILFELINIIKGLKGNKYHFSKNNFMSDDIPCPYYFLFKINNVLKKYKIKSFLDLGCGSGRIIDFFNKKLPDKKFIGIEYYQSQFDFCKSIFDKYKNVKIYKNDFTKINLSKYKSDCIFLNNPFKKQKNFVKFFNSNRSKLFNDKFVVLINYDKNILKIIKNIKVLNIYYINNDKGFIVIKVLKKIK